MRSSGPEYGSDQRAIKWKVESAGKNKKKRISFTLFVKKEAIQKKGSDSDTRKPTKTCN